jgi:lipoprotein-anchoring transpeptidase ErfK/SrfK
MMFRHIWPLLFALTAAIISFGVRAQECDDQNPASCQEDAQSHQSIQPPSLFPFFLLFPQVTAPRREAPPLQLYNPNEPNEGHERSVGSKYAALYAPVSGERFPVPAVDLSNIDPEYLRKIVSYSTYEQPGTIIIDPQNHFLYLIQGGGQAIRYGVGVGRQGFEWSGVATIHNKQEWPDWYPPKEMVERQPELRRQLIQLQSGLGIPGGPRNPLGSRAMYLWEGNKDTLYRIHGTVEPWTIGKSVSSGCIRMINQDVIDLYERAPVGAKVVVVSVHRK